MRSSARNVSLRQVLYITNFIYVVPVSDQTCFDFIWNFGQCVCVHTCNSTFKINTPRTERPKLFTGTFYIVHVATFVVPDTRPGSIYCEKGVPAEVPREKGELRHYLPFFVNFTQILHMKMTNFQIKRGCQPHVPPPGFTTAATYTCITI